MIFRRRRARRERAEEAAANGPVDDELTDDTDAADDDAGEVTADADDSTPDEDDAGETRDDSDDDDDAADEDASPSSETGPWDIHDDFPEVERLDLGAIRVPVVDGFEIQVRMEDDEVVAATVLHGESGLEIMACAAPKTGGLWDDLRTEMIKGLKGSGGRVVVVDGTFGRELLAEVPVTGPDGQQGTQHIRFVGIDGPRWFLRGAFSGRAVDEPRQAKPLEDILRGCVVSRGQQAMAPRELIPLELPREAREALGLSTSTEEEPTNRFKSAARRPGVAG
ncbi:MAG: DUF3710 domain-containing protein [Streptosporangiales bacterium]|nr:DUF3710 domain-containing protein [Streptosporangiales bacterium]